MTTAIQFLSSVEHIMKTRLVTLRPEQSAAEVLDLAEVGEGYPLPVVDSDNILLGSVSASDLLAGGTKTVGQLTKRSRMTALPHESAFSLASRMIARRIDWVPVTRNGELIGVIDRDCIRTAFSESRPS